MINLKSKLVDGHWYHTVECISGEMVVGVDAKVEYKVGDKFEIYPCEYGVIKEIITACDRCKLLVLRIPGFTGCEGDIYIYPEEGTTMASTTHNLLVDGIITAFNLPKVKDLWSDSKDSETLLSETTSPEFQLDRTIECLNDIQRLILEAGFTSVEFKATDADGNEHIINYRSPTGN